MSSDAEDDEKAIQASSSARSARSLGTTAGKGLEEEEKGARGGNDSREEQEGTVALGHLLTNVIILQEFALEAAAVVEVRGALFEEVRYY